MNTEAVEQVTYSTSKGVVLKLRPVSQFKIDTLRASKQSPLPPTYETKVAGGDSIILPLDEESAKNKGRLDEWNEYVRKNNEVEAQHAQKFLEMMIWEGVDVEVPDLDSEWQKSSEYFGLTIPTNPIERKLFYIYNELLGTPDDIGELLAQIFTASQVDQGAVTKLRESFRIGISGQANNRLPKKQRKMENKKSNTQ